MVTRAEYMASRAPRGETQAKIIRAIMAQKIGSTLLIPPSRIKEIQAECNLITCTQVYDVIRACVKKGLFLREPIEKGKGIHLRFPEPGEKAEKPKGVSLPINIDLMIQKATAKLAKMIEKYSIAEEETKRIALEIEKLKAIIESLMNYEQLVS